MRVEKSRIFFYLALLSTFVVLWVIAPISVTPTVKAVISKQKGNIVTIDTPRNIENQKTFYFDRIEFQSSNSLIHTTLGPLGYSDDFFIDFELNFQVNNAGHYTFTVNSDDGFRLWVDGQKIGEFLTDRPMGTNRGEVDLSEGRHTIKLTYFQGYGNLGLSAKYRREGSSAHLLGQSSGDITFEKFSTR